MILKDFKDYGNLMKKTTSNWISKKKPICYLLFKEGVQETLKTEAVQSVDWEYHLYNPFMSEQVLYILYTFINK